MGSAKTSGLSEMLLDLLVCPIDHQPLGYIPEENILYNTRLKKSYEIKDAIPVMLIEQASNVDDDKHEQYLKEIVRYTGATQDTVRENG